MICTGKNNSKQDILHILETRFLTTSTLFRFFWNLSPECFPGSAFKLSSKQHVDYLSQLTGSVQLPEPSVHKPEPLRI